MATDDHQPVELAGKSDHLAQGPVGAGVPAALRTICDLATHLMGADDASVSTTFRGHFITVAATSATAEAIDALQEQLQEGPCREAMSDVHTHMSGNLFSEPRWPRFGRAAASDLGVNSILSHRVRLAGEVIGALNVSSARRDAFGPKQEQLAVAFGAQAALSLRAAQEADRADNLVMALRSARDIGVAIGIIMGTQGLSQSEAFDVLAAFSQNSNRKLAHVARDMAQGRGMRPFPAVGQD